MTARPATTAVEELIPQLPQIIEREMSAQLAHGAQWVLLILWSVWMEPTQTTLEHKNATSVLPAATVLAGHTPNLAPGAITALKALFLTGLHVLMVVMAIEWD